MNAEVDELGGWSVHDGLDWTTEWTMDDGMVGLGARVAGVRVGDRPDWEDGRIGPYRTMKPNGTQPPFLPGLLELYFLVTICPSGVRSTVHAMYSTPYYINKAAFFLVHQQLRLIETRAIQTIIPTPHSTFVLRTPCYTYILYDSLQ